MALNCPNQRSFETSHVQNYHIVVNSAVQVGNPTIQGKLDSMTEEMRVAKEDREEVQKELNGLKEKIWELKEENWEPKVENGELKKALEDLKEG